MQEELKMRMLQKVVAGAAGAAAALTLVAGVALADPPTGVTPSASSVAGVGSRTSEYLLDQLSLDYDAAHPHKTQIYSFDACQGVSCGGSVVLKTGCKPVSWASISGTSAGIAALEAGARSGKTGLGPFCVDFARSSRQPKASDPNNITFVALALDNVTYATISRDKQFPAGSNVPADLTTVQLKNIYSCTVKRKGYKANTWGALLGSKAKRGTRNVAIAPYLPLGAEVLLSFLSAISVPTPGTCVTEPGNLEGDEGVSPIFQGKAAPNILVPYSAGRWVSAYHSAACATAGCPTVNGQGGFIKCKTPTKTQNVFGCNVNGVLQINDINGTSPTTGKGAGLVLNQGFTSGFVYTLYDVVRGTNGSIPSYLQKFFGPKGAFCSKPYQRVIRSYGFDVDPRCGSTVAG
jgi:hypothetical protein